MRHIYITTLYSSKLPFTVDYNCAYCGSPNRCDEQLTMKSTTVPGRRVYSQEKQQYEYQSPEQVFLERLTAIERGEVKIRLYARCENCGKTPAWAFYPRKPFHIFMLILGLLASMLAIGGIRYGFRAGPVWTYVAIGTALVLLFLSFPLYRIRCRNRNQKIAQMTADQLPHVSFRH